MPIRLDPNLARIQIAIACLSFWLASCASAPPNEYFVIGARDIKRAHFLVTIALVEALKMCSEPKVRGCFWMDDAQCVRTIGDTLLRVDRFDLSIIRAADQKPWMLNVAEPALLAALDALPKRSPCAPGNAKIDPGEIVVRGDKPGEPLCVRLAKDRTPCAFTAASQAGPEKRHEPPRKLSFPYSGQHAGQP